MIASGMCMAAGLVTVESSVEGITFALEASQPEFSTVELKGRTFTSVSMRGAEALADFRMPRMPVYRAWLEVPVGAEMEVTTTEVELDQLPGTATPVEPGVLSAPKSRPYDEFVLELDPAVYDQGQSFPESWVRLTDAGMMRGRRLVLVEVMPLRWNPSNCSFDLLRRAGVRVDYEDGDVQRSFDLAERYRSAYFDRELESMLVNYGTFELDAGFDTPPSPYLIVGHEDFVDTAMDEFVSWKESLGFDVTMVDLSVTGSTSDEIKAYIHDAIENWPDPVEFVLLVGDEEYVPACDPTEYSGVTDLYYSALDDGDYLPDAYIGRFSVRTAGEVDLMESRVRDYEQNVSGSTSWVQNTCWIASNDNYNVSEGTHNYCIDNYLDPLGYTWDKVYPVTYGSNADDAIASINGGVSMLTFSGHGSTTSWGDMSFGQSDFNQLTNDGMFPGVLSHSCNTGSYDTGTGWCETWTRTDGRGGLWFWGSDPSTYWDEDDWQQKAEFEAFLDTGIEWPMGFLNQGKMAVYESSSSRKQYYFEGYNLMGDPSVDMVVWGETGVADEPSAPRPGPSGLHVLAPNPVMASTVVDLRANGESELAVFDIAGRRVATPFQGEVRGRMSVSWDASALSPGVYFLRLTQGDQMTSLKVTVIK